MLREPKIDVPNADFDNQTAWHVLRCELVTPMYGGGVESTKVDERMPIRVSAIRGQLRFWWRLLAKHKWQLNNIAQAETNLWGGMNQGSENGKASKVLLKVSNAPTPANINRNLIDYDDRDFQGLRYVLFPAYNETKPELKPHRLLRANNITWDLSFSFMSDISDTQQAQVIETLQWWANFGGLGFRSRKGLGAIHVNESRDFPQICQRLTSDDVRQANCRLVVQRDPTTDALRALQRAVKKLADFRQAVGVGRNEGETRNRPGRSRFPEPDALRRLQGHMGYDKNRHQPTHEAGNIFPRSVFGLPINYQSGAERALNIMLKPSEGERLASPLLLRPTFAGEQGGKKRWYVSALVLPYEHILTMTVNVGGQKHPIWQADKANLIEPIWDNDGGDPLQAFLTYFEK